VTVWYSGAATIEQADHVVLVMCEIHEHRDTIETGLEPLQGHTSWEGSWWSPDPPYTLEAGGATITLTDGRTGDMTITTLTIGESLYGSFLGTGSLPN
jgi:hypothetical protein